MSPASRRARFSCPAVLKPLTSVAVFVALLLGGGAAWGQALPDAVRFGMTPEELQAATGPLELLPGARRTATGANESLRGPVVMLSGVPFEQTFVFFHGRLSRIERLANTAGIRDGGSSLFAQIVAWGENAFGPENRTRDPRGEYASWSTPGEDVYVQRTSTPDSVRLVYVDRQQRDADQL